MVWLGASGPAGGQTFRRPDTETAVEALRLPRPRAAASSAGSKPGGDHCDRRARSWAASFAVDGGRTLLPAIQGGL